MKLLDFLKRVRSLSFSSCFLNAGLLVFSFSILQPSHISTLGRRSLQWWLCTTQAAPGSNPPPHFTEALQPHLQPSSQVASSARGRSQETTWLKLRGSRQELFTFSVFLILQPRFSGFWTEREAQPMLPLKAMLLCHPQPCPPEDKA